MYPTRRRDMAWQKITGLHFDFSYLWNMKLSQQINHHPYPWALAPIALFVCCCAVGAANCACACVHCTTYFNPHFYPGHLCVWCACEIDGDVAMSVCNGLFFITFAPSFHLLSPLTPFHSPCNNDPCVLCLECSVWFSLTWFGIFPSFALRHTKYFNKIYVGWYYFG